MKGHARPFCQHLNLVPLRAAAVLRCRSLRPPYLLSLFLARPVTPTVQVAVPLRANSAISIVTLWEPTYTG